METLRVRPSALNGAGAMFSLRHSPNPEDVLTPKQLRKLQQLCNAQKAASKARERAGDEYRKCRRRSNQMPALALQEARVAFEQCKADEINLPNLSLIHI